MSISKNKAQIDPVSDQLEERLLHIGAGELQVWKYTVLTDEEAFKRVFDFIFSENEKLAWRSAWIIDCAAEDYPELMAPHLNKIVTLFGHSRNSSLNRILTRMLSRYNLPNELLSPVIDQCYKLVISLEPVAVRANAMQVLYNISQQEPDLKPELAAVLADILEEGGTAGLINKAEKLVKRLRKEMIKNINKA